MRWDARDSGSRSGNLPRSPVVSAAKRLRKLLAEDGPLVVPGIYDPLSAKLVARLDFPALYLGGFSAAAQLGIVEPLITLTEQVESARLITKVAHVPLIADGHSGYGDPVHVTRTVREFESAGVAAIHIEDAVFPKRVHYFKGIRHVVDTAEMIAKIRFAKEAQQDADFVLMARTEAREVRGGGLDEVCRRLCAYAEAGADALLPQVWDPEEASFIGREFKGVPLVFFALTRRHKWPELSVQEAYSIGFKVIIYPVTLVGDAAQAVVARCRRIRDLGRSGVIASEADPTWDLVDEVVGLQQYYEVEAATTESMPGSDEH